MQITDYSFYTVVIDKRRTDCHVRLNYYPFRLLNIMIYICITCSLLRSTVKQILRDCLWVLFFILMCF